MPILTYKIDISHLRINFNVKVIKVNHKIKHLHIFLVDCLNSIVKSFHSVKFNFDKNDKYDIDTISVYNATNVPCNIVKLINTLYIGFFFSYH